jgi:hypothetical protein
MLGEVVGIGPMGGKSRRRGMNVVLREKRYDPNRNRLLLRPYRELD